MAGQGVLSKGIKFSYKKAQAFVEVPDLQEVPELGGSPEKVEITTLADSAKRYINGIKDFGDLSFKFLYDNSGAESSYRIMSGLEAAGKATEFQIELPDGTSFEFSANVSTKIDGAGVNAPLTFSAELSLNSDMVITHPAASLKA